MAEFYNAVCRIQFLSIAIFEHGNLQSSVVTRQGVVECLIMCVLKIYH